MLPKIEAAISFANNNPEKQAIITSLENLGKMEQNETIGTVITK